MQYNPSTGHRIKDPNKPGRINWLHSILKRRKQLHPPDWQLTQCLFGEHLLLQHQDKTVALVESEKTAIICAALMPQYLWLATCLYQSAIKNFPGRRIRKDYSDSDPDWEENFYLLRKTLCPAEQSL